MKHIFFSILSLFAAVTTIAQVNSDEELQQLLNGKTKFYDIKNTIISFYHQQLSQLTVHDSIKKERLDGKIELWNRYLYEAESRLKPNGEIENTTAQVVDYLSTPQAANAVASAYGDWTHIGPDFVSSGIGRINRIAFDPVNSGIAYAGSAGGGLYKTINQGITWQNIGSFIPSLGISGIVVSPNNAQEVYVLTGDGDAYNLNGLNYKYGYMRYSVGVLKSTDGGQSWSRTGNFPDLDATQYVGFQLTQDPNNANTLIAATSKGIFKTTNGGNTWLHCSTTHGNDRRTFDVKYKPGSSTTVYCTYLTNDNNGNSCQFAKSEDGGSSFQTTGISYNVAINNANRIVIGVTPANSSYVYLLCGPGYIQEGNTSNDTFEGLYRSTNSGVSFTRRFNSPDILGYNTVFYTYGSQSAYDLALAISPTNANVLITGGLVVWNSTDGGTTMNDVGDYYEDLNNSNYTHPDIHNLAYNPLDGNVYVCSDGGVCVSSDNGVSWAQRFSGLGSTQFYHFEPSNEDGQIWGGVQDNGILVRSGTTSTFDHFDGGDGYDVLTDKPPAGNNNDSYWVINDHIYADGVVTVNITPDINEFFPNLAMSPTNEDVIYAGYSSLYVSYSRGSNWSKISIPTPGNLYVPGNWSIGICPTNRERVYSAGRTNTDKGLYRVDKLDNPLPDEVTNLSDALIAAGYPNTDTKITDIRVSSNGSNRLWVTVGGFNAGAKVFYSNSSGDSWTNISGTLPNLPVNTVVADANDNLYIGTDIGVYYKGFNDADWTPFYNGLPRVPVSELEIAMTNTANVYLYAATYGRGIWLTDIFSTCAANLTVSQNLQGQNFYQAGNINSTSLINGGAGTNVFFRAATQVVLQPGIEVKNGSELSAYIGACNSGPLPFRAIIGDSILNLKRNISAARNYGFVHNVVVDNLTASATFTIFNTDNYTIRIYDINAGKYVYAQPASLVKGTDHLNIPLQTAWGKYLRIDLFKEDMLVHYHDFEKN